MGLLIRIASYLFHPLLIPFAASLLYFLVTPRFFPIELIKGKLMAISIMTFFIPIVFYFMLKTLGKVSSYFLEEVSERKWPLAFSAVLYAIVLRYVLDRFDFPELYYFFLGVLYSTLAAALLVFFKVKISLHMMGLAGITVFTAFLNISFDLDLIYTISFFVAVTGLTATSRLHYKAHSYTELLLGFLIGLIPQLVLLPWWL